MPDVLTNRAILIAEDEYFIANDLERELRRAGAIVVGPVASVEGAMDLIESAPRIDGAILDMNLGGEMAFPVADALRERACPSCSPRVTTRPRFLRGSPTWSDVKSRSAATSSAKRWGVC